MSRRTPSQPTCLDCSLASDKEMKGNEDGNFGEFSKQAKARGFKLVSPQANISFVINTFV